MSGSKVVFTHGDGLRGINLDLVCSWDVDKAGNALLRTFDGEQLQLKPEQWAVVSSQLQPDTGAAGSATKVAPDASAGAPAVS